MAALKHGGLLCTGFLVSVAERRIVIRKGSLSPAPALSGQSGECCNGIAFRIRSKRLSSIGYSLGFSSYPIPDAQAFQYLRQAKSVVCFSEE